MEDFPFYRLPKDIARIVLEEAAISCRRTLLSIILVSHAIHQWIEPILYRKVYLPTSVAGIHFCASIQSRNDAAFFARTVRNLTACEGVGEEQMTKILSSCINISSLSIVLPHRANTIMDIADLRHLSTLKYVTLTDPVRLTSINLLSNINNIFNVMTRVLSATAIFQNILRAQPSVTHLRYDLGRYAFGLICEGNASSELWSFTTTSCPNLRVFVILVASDYTTQPLAAERGAADIQEAERLIYRLREKEARVVIINAGCEDFEGVKNVLEVDDKDDIWEKAEECLKQRTKIQG